MKQVKSKISVLLSMRFVYLFCKFNKMIALNNLEIFDNSRIQRFSCLTKFFFYQRRDIGHRTFSIDQRPDVLKQLNVLRKM